MSWPNLFFPWPFVFVLTHLSWSLDFFNAFEPSMFWLSALFPLYLLFSGYFSCRVSFCIWYHSFFIPHEIYLLFLFSLDITYSIWTSFGKFFCVFFLILRSILWSPNLALITIFVHDIENRKYKADNRWASYGTLSKRETLPAVPTEPADGICHDARRSDL